VQTALDKAQRAPQEKTNTRFTLIVGELSVTASTVRVTKTSFILTSATVRVPTSADCPDSRQGTQNIRPIFFEANVGNHPPVFKGVHYLVRLLVAYISFLSIFVIHSISVGLVISGGAHSE